MEITIEKDSDENLTSSEGSDWSDTDSFDEDVEEIDLIARIRDGKPVRLVCICPSTMITMGRSKMGKSTLATHLIVGEHIKPKPMMYFLVLNAHDKTIVKKMVQTYISAIQAAHSKDDYKPIYKVKTSVQDMMDLLNEETKKENNFPDIPKMIIIDDQLYSNTPNSIQEMINVYGHHTNAFVYVTAHNMFARNQQHIRDNCDYITIFPGQEQARLKKLLNNYPPTAKQKVGEVFSSEVQQAQDGLKEVPVPLSIPVIIDRTIDKISQNYHVLWAGLDDHHPRLIPTDEVLTVLETDLDLTDV
jgi:hypothetical protein